MHLTLGLDIKTYLGISNISDKFLPISVEVGLIWTTSAAEFDHDFLQKSLLDPQCILSLEIFDGFCWIKVTEGFRFVVRFMVSVSG